ncbi:ATP-binding cassette domain-containing protein [Streptococcus suis]|uniref:ATP-binding cassette domain-containing protein n=1 Tax=Streptococcus suis TaxID=1307 RepID=UPI0035A5FD0B
MASLLSTQELSKQYGKQKAVHQVSLTLNKGEICGIVGENGAGKDIHDGSALTHRIMKTNTKPSLGV